MGKVMMSGIVPLLVAPPTFPEEPTSYEPLGTAVSSSTTFVAPENGWYQIELFGKSGKGGDASYTIISPGSSYSIASGGGGGGGAYCCSNKIKLNKNDIVNIIIGTTCIVTINSTTDETYSTMKCTTGNDGTAATTTRTSQTAGVGGTGGTASGGNYANKNGGTGGNGSGGKYSNGTTTILWGGSGGSAGNNGGNVGGNGGRAATEYDENDEYTCSKTYGIYGSSGFCKISRGNTNKL